MYVRAYLLPVVSGFVATLAAPIQAQQGRFEVGLDASFELITAAGENAESVAILAFPAQFVRVGIFLTDHLSAEPTLGLVHVSSGDESVTERRMAVSAVYRFFSPGEGSVRIFVKGTAGLDAISIGTAFDEGETEAQFRLGGGIGGEMPVLTNILLRAGLDYHRSFETDFLVPANRFMLLTGITVLLSP